MKKLISLVMALAMVLSMVSFAAADAKYTTETTKDGWIKVVNEGGAVLGYDPNSGVALIEDDGFAFKDRTEITGLTFPSSVTRIDPWCFCLCDNIVRVILPANMSVIDKAVFATWKGQSLIAPSVSPSIFVSIPLSVILYHW